MFFILTSECCNKSAAAAATNEYTSSHRLIDCKSNRFVIIRVNLFVCVCVDVAVFNA